MNKSRLVLAVAASSIALAGVGVASAAPSGVSTTHAIAPFNRGLTGTSVFTQKTPTSINVKGVYANLIPGNSYYTVIYGNKTCDPAQAFPVGPFTANAKGVASLNVTVPSTVPVSGTMSMSVRRAATVYDVKAGGTPYTLPAVVAVAGTPSIGLIECNSSPWVVTGSLR